MGKKARKIKLLEKKNKRSKALNPLLKPSPQANSSSNKSQVYTWQELEKIVRSIASFLYDRPANPETINGVKCDCVVKVEEGYWVIIEVTKDKSLTKLRTDLAKFATLKAFLHTRNIYAKCYFITAEDPNSSLIQSGEGQSVEVLSIGQFSEKFFNFGGYTYARSKKPFGSAVDPFTGEKDDTEYTPVIYLADDDTQYRIEEIAKLLTEGKYIVLLGNYGTGKSRCIQELFKTLDRRSSTYYKFPVAINLKENWGLKRGEEILNRHLSDLGQSKMVDSLMKIYTESSICFLLDGFDEIGSQSWSDNPEKLKEIRQNSLLGVKELIDKSTGGAIITGREHYFNNNEELINCLGLNKKKCLILRCKDEFSVSEMEEYLHKRDIAQSLPQWLPRRPLICQVINSLDTESTISSISAENGAVEFWELLIDTICEREARIHSALDETVIKRILMRLARLARTKPNDYGPLTVTEIYKAFEEVTGSHTTDETAIMLQRLPGLGRVGPENPDRQFVELYLLDGLRGEDLVESVMNKDKVILHESWRHSLQELGLQYLATKLELGGNIEIFKSFFIKNIEASNKYLLGDILSGLAMIDELELDFHGKTLSNSSIFSLDLSISSIRNLNIEHTFIENLNIADAISVALHLEDCVISKLFGVSSSGGLPKWINNSTVDNFELINTLSRIKAAKFNPGQLIFLSFIRKLFFQHGSGRKENALFRGRGDSLNRKLADRVIKFMIREKLIEKTSGYDGDLYIPNRSYTHRLKQIMDQMSLSKDSIWIEVTKIGSSI
jgi:hypothetical protein